MNRVDLSNGGWIEGAVEIKNFTCDCPNCTTCSHERWMIYLIHYDATGKVKMSSSHGAKNQTEKDALEELVCELKWWEEYKWSNLTNP